MFTIYFVRKNKNISNGLRSAIAKRCTRSRWSNEKARVKRGGPVRFARSTGKLVLIRIPCPAYLDVFNRERRKLSAAFFYSIRKASRRDGVGIVIDFSSLKTVYPAGGILLCAEIQRAIEDPGKNRVVQGSRAGDPIADQVLKQIGVYDLLGIDCPIKTDDETVRHWRKATGTLSDGEKGGTILENYQGRLADGITKGLYDGIVEAMTNTVQHAYIGAAGTILKYGIGRRWWMLSQERDGRLTVVICDLGIGIPHSLPRSGSFRSDAVRAMWAKLNLGRSDGNAISVALELGRSRTNQKGRGKGLSEIVDAVNLSSDGLVLISSNRGIFESSNGKPYTNTDSQSIHGTLILWTVSIATQGGDVGV